MVVLFVQTEWLPRGGEPACELRLYNQGSQQAHGRDASTRNIATIAPHRTHPLAGHVDK
jgi:hypothetical protein